MKIESMIGLVVALASQVAAAAPPSALCDRSARRELTETFTEGNEGGWTLSGRGAIVKSDSPRGNYLHEPWLATFAPMGMTTRDAAGGFGGDFRARRVVELGTELRVFSVSNTTRARPLSVVLISDNGTPRDASDDIYVFQVGRKNIPRELPSEHAGWVAYRFEIPSQSPVLPFPRSDSEGQAGWVITQGDLFTPPADPDLAWNTAIQDVDQVIFWFHDPRYFAFLQDWSVGMDNPTIVTCAE
jgi:hypothetical protein